MRTFKTLTIAVVAALPFVFQACNKDKNPDDKTINIFSVQNDIDLGKQVKAEIFANPSEYPMLDSVQYAPAYSYVRGIVQKILGGGKVFYKDRFAWEVYIVNDDNVLNAFCVPGGYIFVYTGLMKYLDTENQLAGVLAHEIAHADRRHSSDQMTKQYGLSILLEVVLGKNQGTLSDIASNMLLLKYSRNAESEADKYSVIYMCPTDYRADGAAGFFEKLIADGQGSSGTDFFSTHPSPDNRVDNIKKEKTTLGCTGDQTYDAAYNSFKTNQLP